MVGENGALQRRGLPHGSNFGGKKKGRKFEKTNGKCLKDGENAVIHGEKKTIIHLPGPYGSEALVLN